MPDSSETSGIVMHIDGASRGNPGPAAYGVVAESEDGKPVAAFSKFLGETTNNQAEYRALLAALDFDPLRLGCLHRQLLDGSRVSVDKSDCAARRGSTIARR